MKTCRALATSAVVATLGLAIFWMANRYHRKPDEWSKGLRESPQTAGVSPATHRAALAASHSVQSVDGTFQQRFLSALGVAEKEFDSDAREEFLNSLVANLDRFDVRQAIELLNAQLSSDFMADVLGRCLRHWAETEPAEAAFAALETAGENRPNAINGVIGIWAEGNLAEAIDWVRKLPEGASKVDALISVAYEAARTNPEQALTLAVTLQASESRDRVIEHTVAQWATQAPAVAALWADRAGDDTLRQRLQTAVAVAWSDADPLEAASFAFKSISPGQGQDWALIGIMQRWTQKDPSAVATVVEMLPESMRDVAIENLMKSWAVQNPEAAGNWINSLATGAVRDKSAAVFAERIAMTSPAIAAAWAGSIRDQTLREQTLRRFSAF